MQQTVIELKGFCYINWMKTPDMTFCMHTCKWWWWSYISTWELCDVRGCFSIIRSVIIIPFSTSWPLSSVDSMSFRFVIWFIVNQGLRRGCKMLTSSWRWTRLGLTWLNAHQIWRKSQIYNRHCIMTAESRIQLFNRFDLPRRLQ